ncbi:MAG: cell wall hydrolase [Oscillospiraceae bacterium]|nr:cell wall hydrolase [Oscillospiraceae bacterium]
MRKIIRVLVMTMAVLILTAPDAAAMGTTVTGYDEDKNTVILDVSAENAGTSDFVTSFPGIVMENAPKSGRPSPELANQKRQEYVSVPLYLQTDYPDVLYGAGTIETSGCSITSIAMIASYLTGYEYLPSELAYYFGGRATNNMARMECAAETLGLPYVKPENVNYTLAELKAGKCAILLMRSPSPFTQSQHFIVVTGMTADGKYLVNDPYGPNYEKWDLKEGFQTGFPESFLRTGYEGAWVFDKTQMPEVIARYTEKLPTTAESRYPDIDLTLAERQLLARVVWVEARGESAEGQQAVAEVVFNRMASDNFPDKLRDVIYGENQFRSVKFLEDAEPGQAQYQAIERAMYGPYVLPTDVTYFARFATNNNVWGTIGGHIFCYEHPKATGDSVGNTGTATP